MKPYSTEEELPPISSLNEIDFSAIYSYADYMRFAFEDRLEIIKGHIFTMRVPARVHQEVFGVIFNQLYNFLRKKPFLNILDEHGKFQPGKLLTVGEEALSTVLPGFALNLEEVFAD